MIGCKNSHYTMSVTHNFCNKRNNYLKSNLRKEKLNFDLDNSNSDN